MLYVSLGAMPFTCQGGRESLRDASCLTEPEPARLRGSPKLDFVSLEVRVRDNDIPMTHITVAVEGVSWPIIPCPSYSPSLCTWLCTAPVLTSLGHHSGTQPRQLVQVLVDLLPTLILASGESTPFQKTLSTLTI